MRGAAILQIEIDQCLIRNPVFLRLLFEVVDDVQIKTEGSILSNLLIAGSKEYDPQDVLSDVSRCDDKRTADVAKP